MEQMEHLPALFLDSTGSARRIAVPDIEVIGMVRTAILSGGIVLATSLIAVASAATLHIGPFTRNDSAPAPGIVAIHPDGFSPPAPISTDTPDYPPMLIARDPGDEAWQRMLASASGAPRNLPISVTTIDAVKPIGATLAIVWRAMDAPPTWARLSAIGDLRGWGAFIVIPAVPTSAASTPTPSVAAPDNSPGPTQTATPDPAPPVSPTPPPAATPPPAIFEQPPASPPPAPPATGSGSLPVTPTPPASPVPEPTSWISFIIGFGLIGLMRRRTAKQPRDLHRNA
jgi:hypothetical protein